MSVVARKDNQAGMDGEAALVDPRDDPRSPENLRRRLALIRDVAPYVICWWNSEAERCGFPPIPDEWGTWSDVHDKPEDGVHNRECFFNAKYINREHGHPLVLGVYFDWSQIGQVILGKDPTELPISHAVNLDYRNRVVDITWGASTHTSGLMIGRAFGIAPTSDLKTYVKNFGFTI